MVATMHPRSRTTTGLFGATLAVSFLVVGLPHVLPCPVPRTSFADSERTPDGRRRRRRKSQTEAEDGAEAVKGRATTPAQGMTEAELLRQESRECPVPKPSGIIGRVLGFGAESKAEKPAKIHIEERKS